MMIARQRDLDFILCSIQCERYPKKCFDLKGSNCSKNSEFVLSLWSIADWVYQSLESH